VAELIDALNKNSGAAIAFLTLAYVVFTGLLLLEARASRVAATDAAFVLARPTFSAGNELYAVVHLLNLGPAVATDVRLTLGYVNRDGTPHDESRTVSVGAMARGDRYSYEPALMLERDKSAPLPDVQELANRGLTLTLSWSWRDGRRVFPIVGKRGTHTNKLRVVLSEYRDSMLGGLVVLEPTVTTILQDIRNEIGKAEQNRERRRRVEEPHDRPELQAMHDRIRIEHALAVWKARFRQFVLRKPPFEPPNRPGSGKSNS